MSRTPIKPIGQDAVINPDGKRSTNYFYMHDMRNHRVRAYGDSEYGDIHDIEVPEDCMCGIFRDVCIVTTKCSTWIIRHRANGSLYLEDAIGVQDESKVDVSPIITDRKALQ